MISNNRILESIYYLTELDMNCFNTLHLVRVRKAYNRKICSYRIYGQKYKEVRSKNGEGLESLEKKVIKTYPIFSDIEHKWLAELFFDIAGLIKQTQRKGEKFIINGLNDAETLRLKNMSMSERRRLKKLKEEQPTEPKKEDILLIQLNKQQQKEDLINMVGRTTTEIKHNRTPLISEEEDETTTWKEQARQRIEG